MANSYQLRDSFKTRVYAAEDKAFGGLAISNDRFATIAEMEKWVANLTASEWFKRHYPNVKAVRVRRARTDARPCGDFNPYFGTGFIKMPDTMWGRQKWLVCHELGHAVTPLHEYVMGRRRAIASGHGREWRNNYIKLVQHALGEEAARKLKQAFKDAKLTTGVKRTRTLTPEQRAALVERLAKARAAKAAAARPRWTTLRLGDGVVMQSYGAQGWNAWSTGK